VEYQVGAIDQLAMRLKSAGVNVSLESVGTTDRIDSMIRMLIVHATIFFSNILVDLARIFQSPRSNQIVSDSRGIRVRPAGVPPTTTSSNSTQPGSSATPGVQTSSSSANPQSSQGSSTNIQMRPISSGGTTGITTRTTSPTLADYNLLCINNSNLLIIRDDLNLSTGLGTTTTAVVSDQ